LILKPKELEFSNAVLGSFFFTYQASMVIQQVWAYVGKKSVAQSRLENDPYGMAWLTFNR
jgi:hypothetical protein